MSFNDTSFDPKFLQAKKEDAPAAGETASEKGEDTDGDVRERIDKGIKLSEDVAKEAAEKISKQNKERRVEETMTLLQRSDYTVDKVLNRLRKARDIAKAEKEFLNAVKVLKAEVVAGKHDTTSFEAAFKKAYTERDKAYTEFTKTYSNYDDKLRQLYNNSWRYDWAYNL